MSAAVGGVQPVAADDSKHHVGRLKRVLDHVDEVTTGLDSVEVHEDVIGAYLGDERLVQQQRVSTAVVATVADEDARHPRAVLAPARPPLTDPD